MNGTGTCTCCSWVNGNRGTRCLLCVFSHWLVHKTPACLVWIHGLPMPAAFCHFLMEVAGVRKPCDQLWKTSQKACRRLVFWLAWTPACVNSKVKLRDHGTGKACKHDVSRKTWLLKLFCYVFYTFWLNLMWLHGLRKAVSSCRVKSGVKKVVKRRLRSQVFRLAWRETN